MSLYYSDARKINCSCSYNCSTLQRVGSTNYQKLIRNYCSNRGNECGTKLKLINKELIRK